MTSPVTRPTPPERPYPDAFETTLIDIFENQIVFNQVLGLKIVAARPGDIRGRFAMRDDLIGTRAHHRLHGGVTASILDTMGGLAITVGIASNHREDTPEQLAQRFVRMGTIDLRVDYLRQGIGRHFEVNAEVVRLGGRVGSAQMRMHNDEGVLIATATGAYIVS
jgi:uncharacterized protein (TIGR00369 family)